mmetsp:Transcript_21090/g.58634  ORF Transcript_21090/g.58634 Transcript_21090/m.58634 type:complete len:362 (-) Transcript_21090:511-1596(-)
MWVVPKGVQDRGSSTAPDLIFRQIQFPKSGGDLEEGAQSHHTAVRELVRSHRESDQRHRCSVATDSEQSLSQDLQFVVIQLAVLENEGLKGDSYFEGLHQFHNVDVVQPRVAQIQQEGTTDGHDRSGIRGFQLLLFQILVLLLFLQEFLQRVPDPRFARHCRSNRCVVVQSHLRALVVAFVTFSSPTNFSRKLFPAPGRRATDAAVVIGLLRNGCRGFCRGRNRSDRCRCRCRCHGSRSGRNIPAAASLEGPRRFWIGSGRVGKSRHGGIKCGQIFVFLLAASKQTRHASATFSFGFGSIGNATNAAVFGDLFRPIVLPAAPPITENVIIHKTIIAVRSGIVLIGSRLKGTNFSSQAFRLV